MEQQIRFCTTSDGVRIAYATTGEGRLEEAGFLVIGHSDVVPGRPTNDGFVWGKK